MAEIIAKERVPYRIWDKVNGVWNELRFKTNTKSVDAADGENLEVKIGAINGITSDLSGEADDIAASIKCVKELNESLGGLKFAQDAEGNWGYIPSGADTVIPVSGGMNNLVLFIVGRDAGQGLYYAYTENGKDFVNDKCGDNGAQTSWGTVTHSGYAPRLVFNQPVYAITSTFTYSETLAWKLYNSGEYVDFNKNTSGLIAFISADKFNF